MKSVGIYCLDKVGYSVRLAKVRQFLGAFVHPTIRPSYAYRHPVVDYKRQAARGTQLEGVNFYAPTAASTTRLNSFEEPYSKEESNERSKRKYYEVKLGLALLVGGWTYWDLKQMRPLVWCSDQPPPPPPIYPFQMRHRDSSYDIRSVRRGYEVYRQVCATCHSLEKIAFRCLVDEVLPESRVKEIASGYDFQDGPNEQGEMFTRPGKLTDTFPSPYPNDNAARYANGGASPPDLSLIVPQRESGTNYVMALLTGYRDPPLGVVTRPGLYYNTWFPGGVISMAPPLSDGLIEYEDGTPATVSQMAKDVVEFLCWSSLTDFDYYKQKARRYEASLMCFMGVLFYMYRFIWAGFLTRRVDFGSAVRMSRF